MSNRRKTLSVDKADMSEKEKKYRKVLEKRVKFLDVPLLEVLVFVGYVLLNIGWSFYGYR